MPHANLVRGSRSEAGQRARICVPFVVCQRRRHCLLDAPMTPGLTAGGASRGRVQIVRTYVRVCVCVCVHLTGSRPRDSPDGYVIVCPTRARSQQVALLAATAAAVNGGRPAVCAPGLTHHRVLGTRSTRCCYDDNMSYTIDYNMWINGSRGSLSILFTTQQNWDFSTTMITLRFCNGTFSLARPSPFLRIPTFIHFTRDVLIH